MDLLSVKIPRRLQQRISTVARERKASRSAVVREALESYFTRAAAPGAKSCLDGARHLVGCIEGPADLATNKKYMKDFGR